MPNSFNETVSRYAHKGLVSICVTNKREGRV